MLTSFPVGHTAVHPLQSPGLPSKSKPGVELCSISIVALLGGFLYFHGMVDLFADWWNDPALSQGMLIPPLAAYLAWIRRSRTLSLPAVPDNRGLLAVGFSSLLFVIGKLGAEFFLLRLSFVVLLAGIICTFWGYARVRSLAMPLLLLVTSIPLPKVVYNGVSTPLQLFASDAAATIARNFGVTVYRDGNIISLATIILGVEEDCSGLNSLSSLVVAGSLLGLLLCSRLGSRLAIVVLAVPLAVSLNIFRIAATAVLADYHREFAVGFYHTFSGWLIFVAGFLGLFLIGKTLHALFD